jgi:hypothetical protein
MKMCPKTIDTHLSSQGQGFKSSCHCWQQEREFGEKRTLTLSYNGQGFESICHCWQQERNNGKEEHSPHHTMVKGLSPAAAAGSRREIMAKKNTHLIIP